MLVGATLLWGLSYTIQSISAENLGPFTLVLFKGAGGIFLLPILLAQKKKIDRDTLIGSFLMGVFAFVGCLFQQLGIIYSTVSKSNFITALYIVFVPVIELLLGKKVNQKIWLSVGVAIAGLYFLCMNSVSGINIGDLFLLCGAFVFALQIIAIDRYARKCDPLTLTFLSQTVVAGLALIVVIFKEQPSLTDLRASLFPILYIVFLSGLLAQCLQIRYQRDLDSSLASLLMSFESVFGAFFGWLILHQVMSVKEIFGCALVFAAILIAESK